jgi:hypothetical protein
VETRTLDDLVRDTGLEVVDLVKIDVEGHELEVLKGAKNAIERFLPTIFIEYSPQWMSDAAIAEMISYLEQLVGKGYVAYQILPDRLAALDVSSLQAMRSQANLLLASPRSSSGRRSTPRSPLSARVGCPGRYYRS